MPRNTADRYWEKLKQELSHGRDLEEKLDILRRFRKSRGDEIKAEDLAGKIPLLALFEELTSLAEAVLRGGCEMSLAELSRFSEAEGPFAVVAMGKFGGRELTYGSDLDILYLFERQRDREFYTRLGQRIISALTLVTGEGYAYQIDTALRPSGNAGTLVSTLDAFREYHREMGRTWERQALIKGRPILGDPLFLKEVEECCDAISYQVYEPKKIAREINELRERMEKELAREKEGRFNLKTGRGGIVDIEFAVQYLQLVHGKNHPSLRTPNTVKALKSLGKEGFLGEGVAERILKAYLFYREIETRLRLVLDHPTDELIEGADATRVLEERFFKGRSLMKEYLRTREEIRTFYEEVIPS